MEIFKTASRILDLAKVVSGWRASIRAMDKEQRIKAAVYCETVAGTLSRVADAFAVHTVPASRKSARDKARRDMHRELGRLAGNIEDIAALLTGHLDGRKIAGVKRRLEGIVERQKIDAMLLETSKAGQVAGFKRRLEMLAEAEGYFRSLGDGLKL